MPHPSDSVKLAGWLAGWLAAWLLLTGPCARTYADQEIVQGAIDAGVTIIQTAGRSPDSIPLPDGRNLMQMLKDAGMIVIHKCMSIRHALTAERIGVDCISLGGFEYGGHMGNDDVTHWVLQPTAARKLQVPFLVSIAQHQHGSGMTS
jgi:NAD(P)H-dependent flavin oxidoreductase YrpB (nitropropane dioxygenase family)